MLCTEIVFVILSNLCTHVLPIFWKNKSFWQRFTCTEDGWVTLDLQGTKEIKVRLEFLTRFKGSILSRYFLGDSQAETLVSKKGWIKKESEDRFYVGRPWSTSEHMFNFIQAYPMQSYQPNVPLECTEQCADFLKQELNMFGLENLYTVTKPFQPGYQYIKACQFNWKWTK